MTYIVIYIIANIVTLFLWNIIHEMSHIIAAKAIGEVKSWKIKPYPHMYNGNFRFAGSYVVWKDGTSPLNGEIGMMRLAPRIANFFAIELIILGFFLTGIPQMLLLIFCGGGVVDLFIGSLGISKDSDLKVAAKYLEISEWGLRIVGILFSLFGALAILAAML